jgi:3-oxoacyl-[acyl-carrier-protein] synthase II
MYESARSLSASEDYLINPTANPDHFGPDCDRDNLAIRKPKGIDKIDYMLNNSFRMLGMKSVLGQFRSVQFKNPTRT